MYGHLERNCRAKDVTYGLCGNAGLKGDNCSNVEVKYTTCVRFEKPAGSHRIVSK